MVSGRGINAKITLGKVETERNHREFCSWFLSSERFTLSPELLENGGESPGIGNCCVTSRASPINRCVFWRLFVKISALHINKKQEF